MNIAFSQVQEETFQQFSTWAPVLAFPNFNQEFILKTLGCYILVKTQQGSTYSIIDNYASWTLQSQMQYIELELCGL